MASQGNARIDVYIHTNEQGEQTSTIQDNSSNKAMSEAAPKTVEGANSKKQMKGLATAAMIATGMFNYMTSNVGKYTGNSHNQAIVNNIHQAIQIGAMAIVNPYLAIGAVAVQGISYALDENWRKRQESVELGQARARAGYSSSAAVTRRTNYGSGNSN